MPFVNAARRTSSYVVALQYKYTYFFQALSLGS